MLRRLQLFTSLAIRRPHKLTHKGHSRRTVMAYYTARPLRVTPSFHSPLPPQQEGSGRETVLYTFGGPGDGLYPQGVVAGQGGGMFGTTLNGGAYGHGTVFYMAPPGQPGGSWTEAVLWSFGAPTDGADPGPT